jgi:hypothetical protein
VGLATINNAVGFENKSDIFLFSFFPGKTLLSLLREVLMLVFESLDGGSLARASFVCRTWAQLATDVLCTLGTPGQWLRAVGLKQYAPPIRHLTLTRATDLELDGYLPNIRRLSVAVLLLSDVHQGPLIIAICFCGSPELSLHLNFFNDW